MKVAIVGTRTFDDYKLLKSSKSTHWSKLVAAVARPLHLVICTLRAVSQPKSWREEVMAAWKDRRFRGYMDLIAMRLK